MSQENNQDSIFIDGDSQALVDPNETTGTNDTTDKVTDDVTNNVTVDAVADTVADIVLDDDIVNTMDISAVPKDKSITSSAETINIKIKTLKNTVSHFKCDIEKTVGQFKAQIVESLDDGTIVDQMKLIRSGKVLANNIVIKELNINESTDFIVMMISKTKPKPVTSTPVAPTVPTVPTVPTPVSTTVPVAHVPAPTSASTTVTDNNQTAPPPTPTVDETKLENNPLIGTMPIFIMMLAKASESAEVFTKIFENPEVLKQIAQNPQIRNALLNTPAVREEIVKLNPQIEQMMQMDFIFSPEKLKEFLSHPDFMKVGVEMLAKAQSDQMGGMPTGQYGDDMDNTVNDDTAIMDQQIAASAGLSTDDVAIVDEIVSMGIASKSEAIQTYIACDKNKELTINMLLGG